MRLEEKTLRSETIYQGKIITLRKDIALLENDAEAVREVIHHPGGVGIVPLDENGDVIMVRQFRYPFGRALLEIPAGKLNEGEDPLSCGMRELTEETGMVAANYQPLGTVYPTPAYLDEVITIYLATGLTPASQNLDEDEFLEVERYPLDALVDMVLAGEIPDSKTQVAILKTKLLQQGE